MKHFNNYENYKTIVNKKPQNIEKMKIIKSNRKYKGG